MNPSTVIGAAVGLLTLIIVVALSATNSMYFNLPGLAIVLGGTCAALFIAYPLSEVVRVFNWCAPCSATTSTTSSATSTSW